MGQRSACRIGECFQLPCDIVVIANLGAKPVALPAGELLLSSGPLERDGTIALLPSDTTVWMR